MPRVGKIRLGIKAKNAKGAEYPKATDYFVVHADESTPVCSAEAFKRVYGEQPKELDVVIPCEDVDKFFQQWYRRYGRGTGLVCKGDGETATEVDRETGEMRDHECLGRECDWFKDKACKPVGNLMVMLPKVDGLGCWQLDTGSWHSIVQINSSVDFFRGLVGRISGILLKLVIVPKAVQAEGKKKTVYVVDLKAPSGVTLDALLSTPIPGMQRLQPPSWNPEQREAAVADVYGPDPNTRQLPAPPRVVNGDTGEVLDVEEPGEAPPDADDAPEPAAPVVVAAPVAATAPKTANGNGKKPVDAPTAFWGWAVDHKVAQVSANTYLKAAGGDFVRALADMEKVYSEKVTA